MAVLLDPMATAGAGQGGCCLVSATQCCAFSGRFLQLSEPSPYLVWAVPSDSRQAELRVVGGSCQQRLGTCRLQQELGRGALPKRFLAEPADSSLSGVSPPSQRSTVTLEDLELLLTEGLTSPEPLSQENSESSHRVSCACVPEPRTAKRWEKLEQW